MHRCLPLRFWNSLVTFSFQKLVLFWRFHCDGTPQQANANSGTHAAGFAALLDAGFTALVAVAVLEVSCMFWRTAKRAAEKSALVLLMRSSTAIAMLLSVIS